MIDWTQPIETTETPPRPVRVLATDLHNDRYPVVVAVTKPDTGDEGVCFFGEDGTSAIQCFALRNVAPPKPEPEFHDSLEWDELVAERDRWKAQCEAWAAKATEWALERDKLKADLEYRLSLHHRQMAELDRMLPVVGGAVAWAHWNDNLNRTTNVAAHNDLVNAVRAYQKEAQNDW